MDATIDRRRAVRERQLSQRPSGGARRHLPFEFAEQGRAVVQQRRRVDDLAAARHRDAVVPRHGRPRIDGRLVRVRVRVRVGVRARARARILVLARG